MRSKIKLTFRQENPPQNAGNTLKEDAQTQSTWKVAFIHKRDYFVPHNSIINTYTYNSRFVLL